MLSQDEANIIAAKILASEPGTTIVHTEHSKWYLPDGYWLDDDSPTLKFSGHQFLTQDNPDGETIGVVKIYDLLDVTLSAAISWIVKTVPS